MQKPVDPVKFGQRIRERREDLGMSQSELAAAMKGIRGFSQQNIATLEKGKVIKDLRRQAMDLAGPLWTTPEWLLHATGPKSTGPVVLTPEQYAALPLEVRIAVAELAASYRKPRKKA